MSETKSLCEKCGSPAVVHITNDGSQGRIVRHLCLKCADAEKTPPSARDHGLDHAAILVIVGLMVLVISVGADLFAFGSSAGFGYRQLIGVALGMLLLLIGAVIRVPTLAVLGLITCTITILADWLGFGNAEGFGIQQISGTILGISMVVIGLILAYRK